MANSPTLTPQAVNVVTMIPGNLSGTKLNLDMIKRVVRENGIGSIPVVVVAIAGASRRGKSYMINLMIAYLEHKSKSPGQPFQPALSKVPGMACSIGTCALTRGMWLWEKAYVITRKDNSKVAIMLLDTQGICDSTLSANPMVDSQIIYMTLSMATIYIHNVNSYFQMQEKTVYQICQSFNDVCKGSNKNVGPLYNSFTLLVRDWVHDKKFGSREDVYKQEIEKAKKISDAEKIMNGMDKMFQHKTAWVLPVPSEALQTAEESLPLAEAGENFKKYAIEFLEALFSPDGEYSEQMEHLVTGNKFVEMMEELSDRMTRFPDLSSHDDLLKDFFLGKLYHPAMKIFEDGLKTIQHSTEEEALERAEKSAIDYFKTEAEQYKPSDQMLSGYIHKLEEAVKTRKEIFKAEKKSEEEKKSKESFQKAYEELKESRIERIISVAGLFGEALTVVATSVGECAVTIVKGAASSAVNMTALAASVALTDGFRNGTTRALQHEDIRFHHLLNEPRRRREDIGFRSFLHERQRRSSSDKDSDDD